MGDDPSMRHAPEAGQYIDPVIEAYKKDVDRTMVRHNLRLTVQERIDAMIDHLRTIEELHRAGKALHGSGGRAA